MNATQRALVLYVEELEQRLDGEPEQIEIAPNISDGLTDEDLVEAFVRMSRARREIVLRIVQKRQNTDEIIRMLLNRLYAEMRERHQRRSVRLDELQQLVGSRGSSELGTLFSFIRASLRREAKRSAKS